MAGWRGTLASSHLFPEAQTAVLMRKVPEPTAGVGADGSIDIIKPSPLQLLYRQGN